MQSTLTEHQHVFPHRKRAEMRPMDKAAEWRSWRTGPTQMGLAALGSTPTRCITWACTFLAGFAPSCPRQPCEWWRSPGMPTPIPEQGASASASSACHLLEEVFSMYPGTLLAGSTPAPLKYQTLSHICPLMAHSWSHAGKGRMPLYACLTEIPMEVMQAGKFRE